MSRIVLTTTDDEFEARVRSAFNGTLNENLRRWRDDDVLLVEAERDELDRDEEPPELLVFGPDIPVSVSLDVARKFDERRPEISMIIVAPPTPELWQDAIRAGVRDVLPPDAADHELRRSFDKAIEIAARRRSSLGAGEGSDGAGGRVITVVSPKGGAGKTAIASNLAVRLANARPGEVALVDLDLQFGDCTYTLGLDPEHTFADAARAPGVLDLTTLKVFLTPRHGDLYVLCAPDTPAEGEEIPERRINRIIRLLASGTVHRSRPRGRPGLLDGAQHEPGDRGARPARHEPPEAAPRAQPGGQQGGLRAVRGERPVGHGGRRRSAQLP
jgi:pilus assembly protein CpaE